MIDGLTYVPLTDIGVEREENQDYQGHDLTSFGLLFIVADGMGGHAGGATASQMTVNQLKRALRTSDQTSPSKALENAIRQANYDIWLTSQERFDLRGMGSTVVAVLIADEIAHIAHVGDSRIYLLRGDTFMQLTKDHTMVQRMLDDGLLTEEAARHHPTSHVLSRSLGGTKDVLVETAPYPIRLQEGDLFLLCSDGLTGPVEDWEISQILLEYELHDAARILVDLANDRGGLDNTTIALVRIDKLPVTHTHIRTETPPPPPPAPANLLGEEVQELPEAPELPETDEEAAEEDSQEEAEEAPEAEAQQEESAEESPEEEVEAQDDEETSDEEPEAEEESEEEEAEPEADEDTSEEEPDEGADQEEEEAPAEADDTSEEEPEEAEEPEEQASEDEQEEAPDEAEEPVAQSPEPIAQSEPVAQPEEDLDPPSQEGGYLDVDELGAIDPRMIAYSVMDARHQGEKILPPQPIVPPSEPSPHAAAGTGGQNSYTLPLIVAVAALAIGVLLGFMVGHDRVPVLEQQLSKANEALATSSNTNKTLDEDLKGKLEELKGAQETNEGLTKERDALKLKVDELDAMLKAEQTTVKELRQELDAARVNDEQPPP